MNKRARNRLLGVTAIIIIAVAAIIYGTQISGGGGSYARTPSQLAKQTNLVGQRVQVTGPVVAGSWDKKTNPMNFEITDENPTPGAATVKIVYNGGVPTTFGDGTIAIITGRYKEKGLVEAQTLLTKCPSKYQSATAALTVAQLLKDKAGNATHPSEVTGVVVPGSTKGADAPIRFEIADAAGGSQNLPVKWDKGLPAGFKDGATVVVAGQLGQDGAYTATSVAIAKGTPAQ